MKDEAISRHALFINIWSQKATQPVLTMAQNQIILTHLILHFPHELGTEWVSDANEKMSAVERASEANRGEPANEWDKRQNDL